MTFMMKKLLTICSLCTVACSCRFIINSDLVIISFSPPVETDAGRDCEVSLTFNRVPDHTRTEEAFSFTTDGNELKGNISWEDTKMVFAPHNELGESNEYEILLTTEAEDIYGNSLSDSFLHRFRTGAGNNRPCIESVCPADGIVVEDLNTPVSIVFDQAVEYSSAIENFSISPEIKGIYNISIDRKIFTFTPAAPWGPQKEYKIIIEENLRSADGYTLSEKFESSFTAGTENEAPFIKTIGTEDESVFFSFLPENYDEIIINDGIEKDLAIRIAFSEEINQLSAKSSVIVEPAVQTEISFDESRTPADMLIDFKAGLEWQILYRISVIPVIKDLNGNLLKNETNCFLFINGPGSSPPEICRVMLLPHGESDFCLFDAEDPDAAEGIHPFLDTSSGDAVSNPFFIDYYFNLADGANLPFFEFIENFSIIPSDSCVLFDYINFQVFNPGASLSDAEIPQPSPEEGQAVIRLITSLTDNSTSCGIIEFQIDSSLTDSLGNRMQTPWIAEVFDEDN